jgi:hypothetical protein
VSLDPEIYKILPFQKELVPKVITLPNRRERTRADASVTVS